MIREKRHSISGAFVFLLLGVFAVFSMMLVLLGAQAYRVTVEQTAMHTQQRVFHAYVRNAVRADDGDGEMTIQTIDGIPVLTLAEELDGERYMKAIYCCDGELRELFTAEEYGFNPEEGERICAAQSLDFALGDGLLTATITDADGRPYAIEIARRCDE